MGQCKSIHEVSEELGLTSRTLRHWEDKGLFCSDRDPNSSWRMYNDDAINRIRLAFIFRELDISIKDVKIMLDSSSPQIAAKIIEKQIIKLKEENNEITKRKTLLYKCLSILNSMPKLPDSSETLLAMEKTLAPDILLNNDLIKQGEDIIMTTESSILKNLRIISLPAMRVAIYNVVSASPEDEALNTVVKWAEREDLMGTAKIFGFNTTEYSPQSSEYGWAACVTVPEQVTLPSYLEERYLPGGLYASLSSTNEVYDSWQTLVKLLKGHPQYEPDTSRHCLEEHIASGDSNGYYLNLLEPILIKTNK